MTTKGKFGFIDCVVKSLPPELVYKARDVAISHNPANSINIAQATTVGGKKLNAAVLAQLLDPFRIAVQTNKYWGQGGVKLGVQFLDNPDAETRRKILAFANKWSSRCNIVFQESSQGQVRIARDDTGYWSYLGTDVTLIPAGEATMNLQGFTAGSPSDAEYDRVVTHEFGHTCGCPHEHMRKKIIALLDPVKTTKYFRDAYGWSALDVKQQILTPVEEDAILGSPSADEDSIMCYGFPGQCTKNGKPVVGGSRITPGDYDWMGKLYPLATPPPTGAPKLVTVSWSADGLVITPG